MAKKKTEALSTLVGGAEGAEGDVESGMSALPGADLVGMVEGAITGTGVGQPVDRFAALLKGPVGKAVRKKYGPNSFLPATENPVLRDRRFIPTGVYPLDLALGGGIPRGLITTTFGMEASGKTVLCTKVMRQMQQRCSVCIELLAECSCSRPAVPSVVGFVDVEGTYDLSWAGNLGVDTSRVLFTQPGCGEEALDITETLVRSGNCDLVVLDSLAALQPKGGIEREVGDQIPGSQARLIGDAMRRLTAALNEQGNLKGYRPTVMFINQIRMKVGVVYGDPETLPGGLSALFMSGCIIRHQRAKVVTSTIQGVETPMYAEIGATVRKSKRTAPRREASYRLYLADTPYHQAGDFGDEEEVLKELERRGDLTGGGSSWTLFDQKYVGKTGVLERLYKDPSFAREVYKHLMAGV